MSEKLERSNKYKLEIIPLRKHKRISLHCPSCEEFSLMDIQSKTRIKGKVNYYVTCPRCGYSFKQIGRPYNFWRDIRQQYKLSPTQLRKMQAEVVRELFETGEISREEYQNIIKIGDMAFIKPQKGNGQKRH